MDSADGLFIAVLRNAFPVLRDALRGGVLVPGLNEAMDWLVSYSSCIVDLQNYSDDYRAGWNDAVKGCIESIQDALKDAHAAPQDSQKEGER